MTKNTSVFLLDNFDSFTYNLVDELRVLGFNLVIYRNSVNAETIFAQMQKAAKTEQVLLMLSPGPGTPRAAGCMHQLINLAKGSFPILGICLGHQAIVEHYGGAVIRAEQVMHGKSSFIEHSGKDMFSGLDNPLPVARYHSLMAAQMPAQLELVANYQKVPMAVLNRRDKMLGFQFHPESILTSNGSQLLRQSVAFLCDQLDDKKD
jgi:anthranilate synthase component 2